MKTWLSGKLILIFLCLAESFDLTFIPFYPVHKLPICWLLIRIKLAALYTSDQMGTWLETLLGWIGVLGSVVPVLVAATQVKSNNVCNIIVAY